MLEYEAGIIRTERLGGTIYKLSVHAQPIAADVMPGQFVQVRVGEGTDPFLRRTFSVCNADRELGTVSLLVDVVGRGTEMLCSLAECETINMIGPLGRSFDLDMGGSDACLFVAGGVGAAPLLFAAHVLKRNRSRPFEFIAGAKTASMLSFLDTVAGEIPVLKATDDGSLGFAGTAVELLRERIRPLAPSAIFSCGPHPMMQAVTETAINEGIPCQVSLEERMACGIGACLGCAVRMRNGDMRRSCVDGPVFDARELAW